MLYTRLGKIFIKAESSERIKRALSHNVRTYCEESYNSGDKVFYKRRAVKGWKGPATVLGKERNFVLSLRNHFQDQWLGFRCLINLMSM